MRRSAWQRLSSEGKDLIGRLLVLDEEGRLTASQALQHVWLSSPPDERQMNVPRTRWPYNAHGMTTPEARHHGQLALDTVRRYARLEFLHKYLLVFNGRVADEIGILYSPRGIPWVEMWFVLDADEDGRISFEEFVRGFQVLCEKHAVRAEELGQLWGQLDVDRSGYVEWAEWLALAVFAMEPTQEALHTIANSFRLMDRPSSDSVLSVADLLEAGGHFNADTVVAAEQLQARLAASVPPPRQQAVANGVGLPKVLCGICQAVTAERHCLQCQMAMCSRCIQSVHQEVMRRNHRFVPLEDPLAMTPQGGGMADMASAGSHGAGLSMSFGDVTRLMMEVYRPTSGL
eukprot:TRINITY_DN5802_c0_g1_i2.p1 TRINITY_DN5802_c0_g1~~TRINITY_DN5802_c0_g1_i2.p1  ORF type:complete len:378 (+),score=83.36 TRINITY_DN5802_c0_g1_i2:100-1134(+)